MLPHASMPTESPVRPAVVGSQSVSAPVGSAAGVFEVSLIKIEVGVEGGKVLVIRSLLAESELSPLGVTKHEQQATSC